ncbi:hypothetical protein [Ralstonia mannitolilytica]|uniref:Lipoprotein n=1 Tax=Ralstonia mannitolilytica TaxID=105219 RepID=A0AAJ5D731_9RALS|nr:hypothetical protein [Ralstonia mannitolilytica]CAG2131230.1 hypothetical protein LMG6866_00639 [Ralstonia mannitolilytica]CAJ0730843.1 hypothetical protein R77592_02472 [Ralstonia mannitolilytica]SUE24885.1 Uncharacterised protein [Ralstonia mannitolilytica]SUE26419.1 Uncharacterised protein [Ralstonia mannitolilytica]SUE36229.1 Uncharacterised protein [Ralstonia mannitolilytica]
MRTPRFASARLLGSALALGTLTLSGCSSLMSEGTTAAAGVTGAAIATKVTDNAAVATGIGLGVQAGARAALQHTQRVVHAETQDLIAQVAGSLPDNTVGTWQVKHRLPLEPNEQGRVVVTRSISGPLVHCKEILFTVDTADGKATQVDFFIASICNDGKQWKWATAEPATARWGSLQ